jgi:hypothetical protein
VGKNLTQEDRRSALAKATELGIPGLVHVKDGRVTVNLDRGMAFLRETRDVETLKSAEKQARALQKLLEIAQADPLARHTSGLYACMAQARGGEIVGQNVKRGRPKSKNPITDIGFSRKSLLEMGITELTSSLWQCQAKWTEGEIRKWGDEEWAHGRIATPAGLRRAGALLAEDPNLGRGGDRKSTDAKSVDPLSALGISHKQSSRWQDEARALGLPVRRRRPVREIPEPSTREEAWAMFRRNVAEVHARRAAKRSP